VRARRPPTKVTTKARQSPDLYHRQLSRLHRARQLLGGPSRVCRPCGSCSTTAPRTEVLGCLEPSPCGVVALQEAQLSVQEFRHLDCSYSSRAGPSSLPCWRMCARFAAET